MKFQNRGAYNVWRKGLKNNKDDYGRAVYDYAKSWAELMESGFGPGVGVADIAEDTSHEADNDYGITGFMYGCAVSVLSQCWYWGEDLRRWHNLNIQIQTEGEKANEKGTVLNPALLNIGDNTP